MKENKNCKQLQFLSSWRNRHYTVTSYLIGNPIEIALETENLIESIHVKHIYFVYASKSNEIKTENKRMCTPQHSTELCANNFSTWTFFFEIIYAEHILWWKNVFAIVWKIMDSLILLPFFTCFSVCLLWNYEFLRLVAQKNASHCMI